MDSDFEVKFGLVNKEEVILPTPHVVRELICFLPQMGIEGICNSCVYFRLYKGIDIKENLYVDLLKAINIEPNRQQVTGISLPENELSSFLRFVDKRNDFKPTWKKLSPSTIEITNDKASRYCANRFMKENKSGLPINCIILDRDGKVIKSVTVTGDSSTSAKLMMGSVTHMREEGHRILINVSEKEFMAADPLGMWDELQERRY